MKGKFPAILSKPGISEAAKEVYQAGQEMLREIVKEQSLQAKAVYGFFPAQSTDDDIILYKPNDASHEWMRLCMLRQQISGTPHCLSLADFIAPKTSGLVDHMGAFVVTAGHGLDALVARYEKDHDDYKSIMAKAIADRLAEAAAEWLHAQARKDCTFGLHEQLSMEDILSEKYRGIRPAPGYPACPDHTEKDKLFVLLQAEQAIGVSMTSSKAMLPTASVSGWYIQHPDARYFTVGKINKDQVSNYAQRKQMPLPEVEKWLGPNLGYTA